MKIKDLLTPKQIAEKMDVSEQTISTWIKEGMPVSRRGKFIYILEDVFVKWLTSSER